MVQINFALKEVNCKVVYYGPGLSGKTTNLEVIHSKAPKQHIGDLTSIATEGDRTLFFDFLPLNLGSVSGMTTKFQIYTVPGQVYYNSTRKLVLQGADGIVFVADSRRGKMDENLESFANLEENLEEYGMDMGTIPLVVQYNKRDLPDVYTVEEMEEKLNKYNSPYFEAVAVTGEGVFPTMKKLSQMVLESLNRQQTSSIVRVAKKKPAAEQKEPVAVAAESGAAAEAKQGTSAAERRAAARARSSAASGKSPDVVKENVSKSPGVKPIERKAPARGGKPSGKKAKPSKAGAAKQPAAEAKKGKGTLVFAIVAALVVAGGAAAYFSGALDSLLGK